MSGRGEGFSYGKLALASLGAATAVLALAAVLVAVLRPSGVWGLLIALVGVAGAIAAMGVVSTRMTRRAFGTPDVGNRPDPETGADR